MKKIFKQIKSFFVNIFKFLRNIQLKLVESKPFRAFNKVISFIPNYLARIIPHRQRKKIWGVVFVIPLIIGLIYFFIIPLIVSVRYSFNNVVIDRGIVLTPVGLKNYI